MNDPSVRKMKRADELVVGDWLAQDELGRRTPCEVLAVFQYPTASGTRVHLTTQVVGKKPYSVSAIPPEVEMELTSEADLAAAKASAERADRIADVRAFADWLEANPWAPAPYSFDASVHLDERHIGGPSVADSYALVREVAERLGLVDQVEDQLDDRTVVCKSFGHLEYAVIAWHPDGRPAEPAPEPVAVAEHEISKGWKGDEPGECGVECTCGVTYDGFDSLAEASEFLALHIADPSGQDYGRADTAEADDPTPVSGGRIQPHTGEMVGTTRDARLVDADAPESEEPVAVTLTAAGLTLAADASRGPLAGTTPVVTYFSFGHGRTDPGTGKSLLDHYVTVVAPTYDACREAMFASRFGNRWSFDYLAGTARATEWIPRWTEHEVIVAPTVDQFDAEAALAAANRVLDATEATF